MVDKKQNAKTLKNFEEDMLDAVQKIEKEVDSAGRKIQR